MLSLLHIENIAVIELSDIAFDGRLNVLTGETGAGKSIVIDALSALLGQRASRDLIRTGRDAAEVSGVFTGPGGDELMLQRELRDDGRSLCRADGKPVTLAALRELGDGLVNIHGQHDGQALLREETHITYLDAFAGLSLDRYTEAYELWKALTAEQKNLSVAEDEKNAKIALLSHRLEELRETDPQPGEEEELSARRKALRNAESIREALNEAYYALYGDEEVSGACGLAETASGAVSSAARHAPGLECMSEKLREVIYALRDCAEEARAFYEGMEGSEEELESVEERLDTLNRLCRKYNMPLVELAAAAALWEAELEALRSSSQRLSELEGEIARAETAMLSQARELTARRGEAGLALSERLARELEELDMGKVRFAVDMRETEPSPAGCDGVRFLVSANVGEPLKPLNKVASGGEMARLMLAVKNVLAEQDGVQTLVFDEVDSGVSGRAAQRVAIKLCSVSRRKQVLCVTHLPQIAAFADSHFRVEKAVEGERTVTRVQKLDRAGRAEELARIMAGAAVTGLTRKNAEELLSQAEEIKKRM